VSVTDSAVRRGQEGGTGDSQPDDGTGVEREIWVVAYVTEKDLETNEGETEDLYDKLMEMTG
jgi:hypothetical protein